MSRFVIAARTHPDLPAYFDSYEFSVVPNSLFATDGCLRLSTESKHFTGITKIATRMQPKYGKYQRRTDSNIRKVNIFDEMAIVNTVDIKKEKIKTCDETRVTQLQ